jgi:hypothetical protein
VADVDERAAGLGAGVEHQHLDVGHARQLPQQVRRYGRVVGPPRHLGQIRRRRLDGRLPLPLDLLLQRPDAFFGGGARLGLGAAGHPSWKRSLIELTKMVWGLRQYRGCSSSGSCRVRSNPLAYRFCPIAFSRRAIRSA